jgi:hypothetical protein
MSSETRLDPLERDTREGESFTGVDFVEFAPTGESPG